MFNIGITQIPDRHFVREEDGHPEEEYQSKTFAFFNPSIIESERMFCNSYTTHPDFDDDYEEYHDCFMITQELYRVIKDKYIGHLLIVPNSTNGILNTPNYGVIKITYNNKEEAEASLIK